MCEILYNGKGQLYEFQYRKNQITALKKNEEKIKREQKRERQRERDITSSSDLVLSQFWGFDPWVIS